MDESTSSAARVRRLPVLQGVLPVDTTTLPAQILAGVTLAALAIPEVMGYSAIAGMPVVTGLYTLLLPVLAFALLGSSRHLVVGADSATAALLAAGLTGVAATGSSEYVALAGLVALVTGGLLLVARLVRLGFLADFLSRTVLVGFLTGVGIQVAAGQVAGMLGLPEGSGVTVAGHTFDNTIGKLLSTLDDVGDLSWTTVAVSAAVLVTILGSKYVTKAIPGALLAVVGAIVVSSFADLESHGVAVLGTVPGGLPSLGIPDVAWSDVAAVFGTCVSVFIVVLAQSAATSRAYAAKYDESFSENVDLVGLCAANVTAGLSGAFVVNGSPTKTQMVDSAGGRSQVAHLTTGAIVAIVLLFLTEPLQYLPSAVLSAVVFLIGVELVAIGGMRAILRARPDEFVVAVATALAVVLVGVEQAIILAVVLSVIDHLRYSYRPHTAVLVAVDGGGPLEARPVEASKRSRPGLVVYRFAGGLYYANANHLLEEVSAFTKSAATVPLEWFCVDAAAIVDVDYSGGQTIRQVQRELQEAQVRLVFAEVLPAVREELDRYGLVDLVGDDAFYPTVADVLDAFEHRPAT